MVGVEGVRCRMTAFAAKAGPVETVRRAEAAWGLALPVVITASLTVPMRASGSAWLTIRLSHSIGIRLVPGGCGSVGAVRLRRVRAAWPGGGTVATLTAEPIRSTQRVGTVRPSGTAGPARRAGVAGTLDRAALARTISTGFRTPTHYRPVRSVIGLAEAVGVPPIRPSRVAAWHPVRITTGHQPPP